MTRSTSTKRTICAGIAVTMSLLTGGCGFFISQAPPENHQTLAGFSCVESNVGPALDLLWGGLNLLGAMQVASDPPAYEDAEQTMTVGFAWTIISGTAAYVGFEKSRKCRTAKQLLAVRLSQGFAPPTQTTTIAAPAAVEVSPATDTVRVGARLQLVATASASSGFPLQGRQYVWTSSNDAIASVTTAGLVTAHAVGTVVIAARTADVVGTARLVVVAP